ncbi:MAG: Transposase [Cenarchaeum symbiont of Oopsacas minuta]|nr:Transposase [Cenarchaeum symbiont of Oopsacas minuta]
MTTKVLNVRVENRHADIRKLFQTSIPKNVKVVMESSSVWHGLFRYMTDRLDLDVVLSNPYQTKAIAASTKKTDKVDAQILADLLRGGYINKCYVPNKKTVEQRQLVRYRHKLVQARTSLKNSKNSIHGILLQKGIKIPGRTFSDKYVASLKAIKDYRINGFLASIHLYDQKITDANMMIYKSARTSIDTKDDSWNC